MPKILIHEKNFLKEMRNGNEEALCYSIEKYGALVKAVIGKHLYLLAEEQKECFDDVFLNVWKHIDSFDETQSTFKNWIAGIARYKSIDYLRRYRNYFKEVSLNHTENTGNIAVDDRELLDLMGQEISEETEKILQCLKPEERDLFEKLFLEEMTVEEAALNYRTNPNVIYKRLSRARKRMRDLFPERVI